MVVPDGQTVVIGGLMENDKAAMDTKIPLLGDIPILGTLFKRTQRDHTEDGTGHLPDSDVVQMPLRNWQRDALD